MRKTVFILLLLFLFSGCGGSGQIFQELEIPKNKAIVYLYRLPKAWGSSVCMTVKANDEKITRMSNGGYYAYIVTPGEIEFSGVKDFGFTMLNAAMAGVGAGHAIAGFQPLITLNAEAGKTYYLKLEIKFAHETLSVIEPEVGMNEIKGLREFENLF